MAVFSDRRIQNYGLDLPLLCPVATFPHTLEEFVAPKPSVDETIAWINDVFTHPSIDLSSLFLRSREAEHPPTFNERNAIRELMDQCKADIEVLDVKISQTLKTIVALCREVREASYQLIRKRDHVSMAEFILSPPKHLPHDVLEQIFVSCWESMDSSDPHPHAIPLRLAGVCHRWRAVALATPTLWSRIYVKMTERKSVEIAKLCMSRSKKGISLIIRTGTGSTKQGNEFLDYLTDINSSPSDNDNHNDDHNDYIRISRLSIEPIEEPLRKGVHALIERHAKDADELVLFTHMLDDINAPNVKRLYVGGLPGTWRLRNAPNPKPLRFSQFLGLQVLCFQWGIHWPMVYLILDNCAELRSLSVCVAREDEVSSRLHTRTGTGAYTTLEHLEYLAIGHYMNPTLPDDFLSQYTFPKLRTLGYEFGYSEDPIEAPWLLSHPFLTQIIQLTFAFTGNQDCRDTLVSVLRAAHSVERVILSGSTSSTNCCWVLKMPLEVLAAIPVTNRNMSGTGDRLALGQLQELQVIFDLSLSRTYHSYGEGLRALLYAWSTTEPDAISDTRQLGRFVIKCRHYEFPNSHNDEAKKLLSIGRGGSGQGMDEKGRHGVPGVQVHREKKQRGSKTNGFETWPLPFDEEPWYEVLLEDGSWEKGM